MSFVEQKKSEIPGHTPRWHRIFGASRWFLVSLFCVLAMAWAVACDPKVNDGDKPTTESPAADGGSDGVIASDQAPADLPGTADKAPDGPVGRVIQRRWTYRFIAGVSMGGGMSSIIGTRNHEKFDIIGTLGAPNDLRYLFHYINNSMLSGFCDLKKIEAMAKDDKLDTKEAYCAPPAPPARYPYEYTSHYNDWHYDDAGGNWNRPKLVEVLHDLSLALGNPGYFNPQNVYWPHPDIPNDRRSQKDRCANPIRIKGVKHYLYNPEGKYDLITYCDGNTARDGVYLPEQTSAHTTPVEVALAVDINGNGRRDYGEPVIITPYERFEDVGIDGCANDREDGKGGCVPEGQKGPGGEDPNKDDYDALKNPKGTEGNLKYDQGEPFKDFGLDGIDGTKDYGEGDSVFTSTPGYQSFLAHSPRDLVEKMDRSQIDRLNIYIDAGIRDLFNFQVTSLMFLGAIQSHYPDEPGRAKLHDKFISLMPKGSESFDHTQIDWSDKGQHLYVRYGDPNATPTQISQGDGDHVNGGKIIDRLFSFMSFVKAHMPDPDVEPTPVDRSTDEGTALHFTYESKALRSKNLYSVVLPPGYYAEADKKYPVLYFGHGYGMDGPGMSSLLVILIQSMKAGTLPKMIMVSVHGGCKQMLPVEGEKGKFTEKPWGGCHRGTFYINAKGINDDGLKMEDAFFEVVAEVEKRYGSRIRQPETRPYRIGAR